MGRGWLCWLFDEEEKKGMLLLVGKFIVAGVRR